METKNMKTVNNFAMEEKLKYLRGMCLNNSCLLLAGYLQGGKKDIVSAKDIYDYAELIYDEGVRRDWVNYHGKETAKTATIPVIMTEKGYTDPDLADDREKEELMI